MAGRSVFLGYRQRLTERDKHREGERERDWEREMGKREREGGDRRRKTKIDSQYKLLLEGNSERNR